MLVKLTAVTKVSGQWRKPGESVELPDNEARRLIGIKAAEAVGEEPSAAPPVNAELEAMRAELARLQEFERQQLAAANAEAQALAEKEEADRKAAEAAAAKGKGKAAAKDDADGQADGK